MRFDVVCEDGAGEVISKTMAILQEVPRKREDSGGRNDIHSKQGKHTVHILI